jgi:hypothetical protein
VGPRRPERRALPSVTAWHRFEQRFDRAFGSRGNPLRQLGTLAFLALWLLALTGIWLYIVLDTSVAGAHESIDALSRSPWSPGGLVRSLHRYAADAFVLFTGAHLLRELLLGRWRHFRRFSWLTGTALLPLIAVSAIGGFWLNWDRLGQFSAIATAEWLDALPLLANPFARNFIGAAAVNDRLFSLFVFVHLGVPLLLVYGLWFHIQRITRAAVFPPRVLGFGAVAMLLALCVLAPVTSQAPGRSDAGAGRTLRSTGCCCGCTRSCTRPRPASPGRSRSAVSLRCLRCPSCPAAWRASPWPWSTRRTATAVNAASSIAPTPRSRWCRTPTSASGASSRWSTPTCVRVVASVPAPARRRHRSAEATRWPPASTCRSGRSMRLRRQLRDGLAAMQVAQPIAVFSCRASGADARLLQAHDTLVLPLICAGQLPPSFVEYALRDGASGVVVATCRDGGCDLPPRRPLDRRAPGRHTRAASARRRADRAGAAGAGRRRREPRWRTPSSDAPIA